MFAIRPTMTFTLRVVLIAVILFNALAPITSVSAISEQETQDYSEYQSALSSFAPTSLQVDDDSWLCFDDSGTWFNECQPNTPGVPTSTYMANGTQTTSGKTTLTYAKLNCTTRPGCINDDPVYFRLEAVVDWELWGGLSKRNEFNRHYRC